MRLKRAKTWLGGFPLLAAMVIPTLATAQAQPHEPGDGAQRGLFAALTDLGNESPTSQGGASDDRPFSKGDWTIEPYAFALDGLDEDPSAELYGGGLGLNYYFK